jgi:hypothetical protein
VKLLTVFDEGIDHPGSALYTSALLNSLRRIFPDPLFFEGLDEEKGGESLAAFERALPLLKWSRSEEKLSLFFLAKNRVNIGKIFYDMINQWLMPGQRVCVSFFFSADFKLVIPRGGEIFPFSMRQSPAIEIVERGGSIAEIQPPLSATQSRDLLRERKTENFTASQYNLSPELYTLCEMVVQLSGDVDAELLRNNLRVIETEIRLGMVSFYHTNRILEVHGLRGSEKHAHIQEKIVDLIQKKPDEIDYDIFGEMQHFFVMSKDEFKAVRETHYLSRLVALFYIFRKSIQLAMETNAVQRHIRLKIHPVNLHLPWGVKKVLGICVGLNFLKRDELFEERHLVKALKNALFHVKPVQDSFFVNEGGEEGIHTLYIEIEKEEGGEFSKEEIRKLRLSFPSEMKGSIEVALRPLFMPRNEEEVIRHIVTLSRELRFVKDLPQVVLSFDEQIETELCFTVILVRVVFPEAVSIEEQFDKQETFLNFSPDRVKRLGMLRKKYPKEATVFRVRISSERYMRPDGLLDLFKARQEVICELQRVIGEVRDYNGGMLSKQIELLDELKQYLDKSDEILAENLFHSLFPIEMRSILTVAPLKTLFLLIKHFLEQTEKQALVKVENEGIYFIGRQENPLIVELFEGPDLLIAKPTHRGTKFFGGIYFYKTDGEKQAFIKYL